MLTVGLLCVALLCQDIFLSFLVSSQLLPGKNVGFGQKPFEHLLKWFCNSTSGNITTANGPMNGYICKYDPM